MRLMLTVFALVWFVAVSRCESPESRARAALALTQAPRPPQDGLKAACNCTTPLDCTCAPGTCACPGCAAPSAPVPVSFQQPPVFYYQPQPTFFQGGFRGRQGGFGGRRGGCRGGG